MQQCGIFCGTCGGRCGIVGGAVKRHTIMANTITKRELVNKICAEMGSSFTQNEVLDIVQKTIDTITDCLGNGDRVVLRNFGTFTVKEVKAKVGRNPKDPAKNVPIPPRSVVKFKVGKTLKDAAAKLSE